MVTMWMVLVSHMGILISIFGPLLHDPLVAPAQVYHHLWSQATTSVMVTLNSCGKDVVVVHVVPSITLHGSTGSCHSPSLMTLR
jgi:hypothetical protein